MKISIILEWENALLSELDRTAVMIQKLFSQMRKRKEDFELIIVHDPDLVDEPFILDFLQQPNVNLAKDELAIFRFLPRLGMHYFVLKNEGVMASTGDTVILIDSDVIPEDGWLSNLIEAFLENPDSIIGGLAYIDFSDFIGKCFALGWFFPLRPLQPTFTETSIIFSNNLIASRELLITNPYPDMADKVTRSADLILWQRLREKGIKIFFHTGACVSHPSPNGLSHFLNRGLAEGRDDYLILKEPETKRAYPSWSFIKIWRLKSWEFIKKLGTQSNQVEMKAYQKVPAFMVMFFYYLLFLIGGILTMLFPSAAKKAWQI